MEKGEFRVLKDRDEENEKVEKGLYISSSVLCLIII